MKIFSTKLALFAFLSSSALSTLASEKPLRFRPMYAGEEGANTLLLISAIEGLDAAKSACKAEFPMGMETRTIPNGYKACELMRKTQAEVARRTAISKAMMA